MTSFTRRRSTVLGLVVAIAALAGCGGSSGGDNEPKPTPPANQKPAANAGPDLSVDAHTLVELAGSGTDSDGSIVSFSWTQTEGVEITLANGDSQSPTFTAPNAGDVQVLAFELTVTDNDGATATDTVSVTIAPVVTLSGRVYDGPIANARVTVKAGDRTYTATADEDGNYTINVGAIDPGAFVSITATGGEGQEHVELISIAGSFGALQSAAGDGGILDSTKSGSVSVTNLSTAKAVLMIQANGGNAIVDDEALTTAEANVSGDDVLYLATVIKLVIDGGHALPEGVASTLALIDDQSKTDEFVSAVDASDPAAFGNTYDEMINDGNLMSAYTASTVPTDLFTLYVSSNDDRSLTYRSTNRGKAWKFGSDGKGTRSDAGYASAGFSWTVTDGAIVITYDSPLESSGWCRHPDGIGNTTYWCESETNGTTIQRVVAGTRTDTLLLSSTGETIYPNNPELQQPIAMSGGSTNLGLQASAAIPFVAADVPGTWISAVTGRADPSVAGLMLGLLDSGFMKFNQDGSGERTATDHSPSENFTWAVDGGLLVVDYVGGDKITYYRMRLDGDVYDTLAFVDRLEGGRHADAGLMLEVDVARLPLLESEDIPARYVLFEKPNDFSIRFADSGLGANEYYDENGPFDSFPFSWALRDDFVIQMSYFWDPVNGDTASCMIADECHLYLDRLWYPAAYNDHTGRVYLLEIQQRYGWVEEATYHQGPLTYYQPSVRYWGRQEFASEGGMSKMTAPVAPVKENRPARILSVPAINSR